MKLSFKKHNQTNKIDVKAKNKNEFYFIYASALLALKNISGPAIKVYSYLLLHHEPGIPIGINKAVKEQIMKINRLTSAGTISNALTELCKHGLLFRVENARGAYIINPTHAWYGNREDREKAIFDLSYLKK